MLIVCLPVQMTACQLSLERTGQMNRPDVTCIFAGIKCNRVFEGPPGCEQECVAHLTIYGVCCVRHQCRGVKCRYCYDVQINTCVHNQMLKWCKCHLIVDGEPEQFCRLPNIHLILIFAPILLENLCPRPRFGLILRMTLTVSCFSSAFLAVFADDGVWSGCRWRLRRGTLLCPAGPLIVFWKIQIYN